MGVFIWVTLLVLNSVFSDAVKVNFLSLGSFCMTVVGVNVNTETLNVRKTIQRREVSSQRRLKQTNKRYYTSTILKMELFSCRFVLTSSWFLSNFYIFLRSKEQNEMNPNYLIKIFCALLRSRRIFLYFHNKLSLQIGNDCSCSLKTCPWYLHSNKWVSWSYDTQVQRHSGTSGPRKKKTRTH